jgi:hypothetical protein
MSQNLITPQKLGRKKEAVFSIILVFILLIFLELSLRGFFAIIVGPDVLLYGTRFCCGSQKSFDQKGAARKEEEELTVSVHENIKGNYSKYFPNQIRTDIDEHGEIFSVTINSRGFRGKDFSDQKAEGVIRVITLGASSTFGYHNRDNETYPYVMESTLNQSCTGKSFEVINFGIPHSKSDNIYSLFLSEAVDLNPNIVTFYEGINDSEMEQDLGGLAKSSPSVFSSLKTLFYTLRDRLITLALLDNWLASGEKMSESDFHSHLQGRSEYFLKNLSLIHEECEKRGILFIVANQQAKSYAISREDIRGVTYDDEVKMLKNKLAKEGELSRVEVIFLTHAIIMEDLKDWALANNVPFVDVIKATDQDRDTLLSSVHVNPRGNKIIAAAFAEEILKHVDCGMATIRK